MSEPRCPHTVTATGTAVCDLERGHSGQHVDPTGIRWGRARQPLWGSKWDRWATLATALGLAGLTVYRIATHQPVDLAFLAAAGWAGRYLLMAERGWPSAS